MGQQRLQTPPDAELVYAARSGLKEPMAELLRRHWDTAVLLAERVLGSPDLARDAVQEAAIAAMTDVERLRSPDRFGAWFCGIALNVSRKWLRQLRSEQSGLSPDTPSEATDPAEAAEIADTAARVRRAIAALADGQQDAVRLFYLQGLSHREVAAELGVSVGAVKSRLHQARAALAPRLAPLIDIREETAVTTDAEWVDATVTEVRRDDSDPQVRKHIMVLEAAGRQGWLPIWIGPAEATALALILESVETPRPLTFQLAASLLAAAGGRATETRITRLDAGTFYAVVVVDGPAGRSEVDARPSDAVTLATMAGTPIRVDPRLFAEAGQTTCPDWRSCPTGAAELAAEDQRRRAELYGP